MNTGGNFLDVLILLGALQGGISAILLFRNKQNPQASRLLAWLLVWLSLACLNIYWLEAGPANLPDWVRILEALIPLIIIMPVGPLIYFYTQALTYTTFVWEKKYRLHFYPVLLDLLPYLTAAVYVVGALMGWIEPGQRARWVGFIDGVHQYADIPRWLSITGYLYLSSQWLQRHASPAAQTGWAKQLLWGFAAFQFVWLLFLVPYIMPATTNWLLGTLGWYPIYLPLMAMVYWLGVKGYLLSQHRSRIKTNTRKVDDVKVGEAVLLLKKAMLEDQLFLNNKLTLQEIVEHTGIPQKTISLVLNQHLGKNFNTYVNGFRIEEVKKRLADSAYDHLTITGIALECGFNSQATFQRTFKMTTGRSPGAFRREKLNRQAK